jgi:hypothetical protein
VSYQRDPDAYTRGVGAVQAVDKVLAKRRFANPRARAAMVESVRRDRLRQKLLRPGLGAISTSRFTSAIRMPVTRGGVDSPGMPPMQPVTPGGGGFVAPPTSALTAVNITQPVSVRSVFTSGVLTAPGPGRPWGPTDPVCGPTQSGVYPNCVNNTFGTSGGNSTTSTTTATTTTSDGTVIPTSSVGLASGASSSGAGGVMTALPPGVTIDPTPIDTTGLDTTGLTTIAPAATDYMKYLPYAAVGIALFLYMRSQKKGA